MKLISLKTKNFRRFYGEQEVEFSTDPKKNFTIIHAENGTGKTNLLNAINWCLYGEMISDTSSSSLIINSTHDLEDNKPSTDVKLVIQDDNGTLVKFHRKQIKKNPSVLKAYSGEDEEPIQDRYVKEKIESLIPKELSKYFFFHGEGLKSLTTDSSNIESAVRDIQGITDTQAVHEEIIRNRNTIYGLIRKSDSASESLKQITEELEAIDNTISLKKEKRDDLEKKRASLNDELTNISKLLANSNEALVKKHQNDRKDAEKQLNIRNAELKNHTQKKYDAIKNFSIPIINIEIALKCKNILDDLQEGGKFPADLSEDLLDGIFEKQECICGTPVKVGSNEFKKLQLWKDVATSAKFTSHVLGLNKYEDYIKSTQGFSAFMISHEETKGIIEDSIQKNKKLMLNAESFLASTGDHEVTNLNQQQIKLTKERDDKNIKIKEINEEIAHFQFLRGPIKLKHNEELKKSKVDPEIQKQYEFLEVAARRLKKLITSYESEAKEFVKNRINEYFSKYATKNFKIEFDESFRPKLKEKNIGDVYTDAPQSSGESLLKNIAFICSLIEFSKSRVDKDPTKYQIQGVRSPLVIDAPFGDADDRYSSALANILVNCNAEQVIIFLSKKHYKGSFEEITNQLNNVGSRYIIDNYNTKSESDNNESSNKNSDNQTIKIGNKTYTQIHTNESHGYSLLRKIDG